MYSQSSMSIDMLIFMIYPNFIYSDIMKEKFTLLRKLIWIGKLLVDNIMIDILFKISGKKPIIHHLLQWMLITSKVCVIDLLQLEINLEV